MSIPTTTASPWPSRAAYFSAAVFIGASGATNVIYGWQKGTDLPTSLVWTGVAGAVAVIFALSWPALIRSLEARRWSAALFSLLALLLAGTYSVTAALGSAAGGRTNASATETATTGDRQRAQSAYDTAKTELGTLKPARPVAELEALIARNREAGGRCAIQNGTGQLVCPPHPLAPELARSKRRAELEGKIEREATKLATTGPAKVANADSKALAGYFAALGYDVDVDRISKLLVLLAVLLMECGAGLSLTVGLALSGAVAGRPATSAAAPADQPGQRDQPAATARPATQHPSARPAGVVDWLAGEGGRVLTSRRQLAAVLGRRPTALADELQRLAAAGAIRLTTSSRGTLLELAGVGRPN